MKMLHQVLVACLIGGDYGVLGHVKKEGASRNREQRNDSFTLDFLKIFLSEWLLLFCLFYLRNLILEFSLSCYRSLPATAVKLY